MLDAGFLGHTEDEQGIKRLGVVDALGFAGNFGKAQAMKMTSNVDLAHIDGVNWNYQAGVTTTSTEVGHAHKVISTVATAALAQSKNPDNGFAQSAEVSSKNLIKHNINPTNQFVDGAAAALNGESFANQNLLSSIAGGVIGAWGAYKGLKGFGNMKFFGSTAAANALSGGATTSTFSSTFKNTINGIRTAAQYATHYAAPTFFSTAATATSGALTAVGSVALPIAGAVGVGATILNLKGDDYKVQATGNFGVGLQSTLSSISAKDLSSENPSINSANNNQSMETEEMTRQNSETIQEMKQTMEDDKNKDKKPNNANKGFNL